MPLQRKKHSYPSEPLGPQRRPFSETFSGFRMLRDLFAQVDRSPKGGDACGSVEDESAVREADVPNPLPDHYRGIQHMTDKLVERLRETLEPFAKHASGYESVDGQHDYDEDFVVMEGFGSAMPAITVGHLRNARAALESLTRPQTSDLEQRAREAVAQAVRGKVGHPGAWKDVPADTRQRWLAFADEFLADPRAKALVAALASPEAPQDGEFDKNSAGNRDCLAKAKPGEPMFIILGRDPDGANIVRLWADRRAAAGGDPEHAAGVRAIAEAMRQWAADPANAPASAPPASAYPPPEAPQDGASQEEIR